MTDNEPIKPKIVQSQALVLNTGNQISQWKPIIDSIVSSKTCGVKNEGDAYLVLLKAHELGIGFTNALSHVHIISGKIGIDIHIIKAILSNPTSGVTWTKTFANEPVYNCLLSDKSITTSDKLPENAVRVTTLKDNPVVAELDAKGKVPYRYIPDAGTTDRYTPVNYITEYKFKRDFKNIKGEWETKYHSERFSKLDVIRAGLNLDGTGAENKSSAWYKYEPLMIDHRCFTFGARAIASDLLMGTSSYDELLEINGFTPSEINEEGTITQIIAKDGKKINYQK